MKECFFAKTSSKSSGILALCSIVPYHNWNFFGLSMVLYMSKIFLRYGYSVCILLLHLTTRFPSIFGNGAILPDVKNFIKCGLKAAESYVELDGSSQNARLVANSIESSPQSTPFFCCCTGMTWIINSFSGQNEYAANW